MKRLVKLFFASVLCSLALASCVKPEEIENLQNQINEIKQENIASIESQIKAINSSITKLETTDKELKSYIETLQAQQSELVKADEALTKSIADLREELLAKVSEEKAAILLLLEAYKSEVEGSLAVINVQIAALQSKDENLQTQITTLKTYVDAELQNTKDWATATFATLEQYNSVCTTVAGIQANITAINETIANLQTQVTQDKTELEAKISEIDEKSAQALQTAVSQLNTTISNAKDEITAAYTSAIATAISGLESSLKTWVNNQLAGYYTISQVDALLATLESSMNTKLNAQKEYLEGQISQLESTLSSKIAANTTLIEGLQGQLNTFSSSLTELASQVAQNSADISANAAAIIENAKAISANESSITSCEQLIASNKALIDANNQKIAANVQAIADLQSKDAELYAAISANVTAIQKNASDIAANSALISANAVAIANNATAISNNAAAITQLQENLATAKTELTEAYTTAIATAIYTLDGKLSAELSTQISAVNKSLEDAVKTINDKISALTLRMDACEEEIDSIKDLITDILSDINDLQDQIDKILSDKIASIESQITNILASIGNLETTDAALKDYIKTLQEQYQALVTTDAALTKAIEDLKAELLKNISDEKTAILLMLETYKGEVAGKLEVIGNSIESLQAKDQELEGKITALKEYVDAEIKNTKDWATATFATLEQYNSVCTTVAGIQADIVTINTTIAALDSKVEANQKELKDLISALDEKTAENLQNAVDQLSEAITTAKDEVTEAYTAAIESAISALETSLKNWVNSQLSGYYTIAQTNAQIEALATSTTTQLTAQKEYLEGLLALLEENLNKDIEANKALIKENKDAIAANAKAIEDNAKNIAQLQQDLTAAKTEITAAYTAAITSAITELEGKLSAEMTTKIAAVNKALEDAVKELDTKITALSDRIDACEQDIADLKDSLEDVLEDLGNISESLDKLLARIQSMTVVPTYTDGSVKINSKGTTDINFVVLPRSASEALAKVDLSAFAMKAVATETKASMFIDIPVTKVADNGEVLVVTVDGTSLPQEFFSGTQQLNAMFKVEDGNNARATEFFALSRWIVIDPADIVSFADDTFKNYCVANFDTDGNGVITKDEALAVTTISATNLNIASLTGIENFKNLVTLNVTGNKLSALNLSACTNLQTLNCSSNSFSGTLDVSQYTSLTTLNISNNANINGLKYVEGLKITTGFSVGRYIVANGVKGVVFYVSGNVTKIVSLDQTKTTWGYDGTLAGASSNTDGKVNTAKIPNSPAAKWCKAKGANWYLPAIDELKSIAGSRSTLNTSLSQVSGTQIVTSDYWSSTEPNASRALYIRFHDGNEYDVYDYYGKTSSYYVRAVRAL